MKCGTQFEEWYQGAPRFETQKQAAEAAWDAAIAAVEAEPENDPKAIGVRILERANALAEEDMLKGNPITGAHHRAIEKLMQELRS